jgi:hypothetical protein
VAGEFAVLKRDFMFPATKFTNNGKKTIIYLACPYTDRDPVIRRQRFELATAAAATLVRRGLVVYSPITMTHPMDVALSGDNTLGSDFWVKFDEAFMEICSDMIILQVAGWGQSSGIQHEIEFFKKAGKPISFMQESDIDPLCLSKPRDVTKAGASPAYESHGYQDSYGDKC